MKIFCKFPTVNLTKLNFWLVILIINIAKNLIRTILKVFSIFRYFCTFRFHIFKWAGCILAKYCPYINKPYINGKLIYSAFRICILESQIPKIDLYVYFFFILGHIFGFTNIYTFIFCILRRIYKWFTISSVISKHHRWFEDLIPPPPPKKTNGAIFHISHSFTMAVISDYVCNIFYDHLAISDYVPFFFECVLKRKCYCFWNQNFAEKHWHLTMLWGKKQLIF